MAIDLMSKTLNPPIPLTVDEIAKQAEFVRTFLEALAKRKGELLFTNVEQEMVEVQPRNGIDRYEGTGLYTITIKIQVPE